MRVVELRVYPVKSLSGRLVPRSDVLPWGLAGDRRWELVDAAGDNITARRLPSLLGITAHSLDADTVELRARDGRTIVVPAPVTGERVPVTHSRVGSARLAGPAAQEWVAAVVGVPLRLVWQDDPRGRPIAARHGGRGGDVVSLADTSPLLLTTQASLRRLQEWVGDAGPVLSMTRFRPNVVVDGEEPFAEDDWEQVQVGGVRLRRTELCDRCMMTMIDPETLQSGKEPIRTLARHRRWEGATWFGIRMAPLGRGPVAVGDAVTVHSLHSPRRSDPGGPRSADADIAPHGRSTG